MIGVLLIALLASVNGANKIKAKIVNGMGATVGQFPFYAHLDIFNRDGSNEICGATIISDEWLITAAHCTFYAKYLTVHLGMSRLSSRLSSEIEGYTAITVEAANFFEHPNYIGRVYWNDIGMFLYFFRFCNDFQFHFFFLLALIKLPRKVQFSNYIQPVRMPSTCMVPQKTEIYAMGNGRISTNGDTSEQLLFATLETLPLHVCWRKYPILFLRKSIVCAIDKENYQSVCDGDSGGPLVMKSDGTLIGITTFVAQGNASSFDAYGHFYEIQCSLIFLIYSKTEGCNPELPQVFSNIITHLKWIKQETGLDLPDC